MSLSLGGWVIATGGKTTVIRQAQAQTKYKGHKVKACVRDVFADPKQPENTREMGE